MSEFVRLEIDAPIATLTIDRPKLNPLNSQTLDELAGALQTLYASAPDVRVLIVTGAGRRAFVAGADIKEMATMSFAEAWSFSRHGQLAFELIEQAPFVSIAAVNGFALGGGCELALACDIIYAAESAMFGQPEVNLGVIPGFGGTQRLARVVGTMLARELVLTGRMVNADEALRIGLAAQVFPSDELLPRVREIASTIATKGPLAVHRAKQVMARGNDMPLSDGCRLESEAFAELFGTGDQKEGMTAYLEKREPRFTGS